MLEAMALGVPVIASAEPHPTSFLLQRYFLHREYEFALGVLVGFLLLAAKMAWL